MKIKVANIIEEGRFGGPQNRILEVAKCLYDRGIHTTVIFPKYRSETFDKKLNDTGVESLRIQLRRLTKDQKHLIKYVLTFMLEVVQLSSLFRRKQFHIIHCSGGAWQYKGVIAGKLAGVKVIWHVNDTVMPVPIRMVFRILVQIGVDGLIVAGHAVKNFYIEKLRIHKLPVFEIQAPVDTKYFSKQNLLDTSSKMNADAIKILSVANINPLKGIEYLVKAAALLNQENVRLHFYVAGSVFDSQADYYKSILSLKETLKVDNFDFLGGIEDIRPLLMDADIYVCPSISEASPMSVWEAMSMGKAIVATDVGDVSRFIRDAENGFVVPPKAPEALAERISRLVADSRLRKRFGSKARQTAQKELDISIAVRRHIEAYQKVMGLTEHRD